MTACIFHDTNPSTYDRLLFEVVENAYGRRERVLVYTRTTERAAALDRMLWITKQESFMPHRILSPEEKDPDIRVAIVSGEFNPIVAGTLVVDSHCNLDFSCGFDHIHEFVNRSNPDIQQACRDRYRDYQSRRIAVEYSQ